MLKKGSLVTVTDLRTGKRWDARLLHRPSLTNTHVVVERESDGRNYTVGKSFVTERKASA